MIFLKRLLGAVLACAVWGTAISGLSLAAAQPAVTEGVFSIGIPSAESSVPAESGRAVLPAPSPAQVQAVWDLGAAGNWASASRLLKSLEAPGTGWTAPLDLRAYVSNGQRDARIAAMLEAKDWTAALKLLPAAGRDPCAAPFRLWARADATEGLGAPDDIRAFYISTLNNCSDRAIAAALAERSLLLLDADGLASVRETASLQGAGDPEMASVYARVLRTENRKRFDVAAGQGDLAAVARLANGSVDAFLLAQAGWVLLEPDTAASAGYFERALALGGESDARRGLIMANLAAGDIPAARAAIAQAADTAAFFRLSARADLAEAADRRDKGDWTGALELAARAAETDASLSADAHSFTGATLLVAANDAYEQGVYDRAAVLARQASDYPSERRAGLMRAAWADYQRGDAAGSAAGFSRLYVESADAESAEGFALAAEKSGDLDSAAAIARALGGPLGAKVNARYAAAAFSGGDYLTARAYAPDTYDALEGVDRPWYRQAVAVRSQSGTSGENRLSGAVATTSAGRTRGADRMEAGVSVYTLDPGSGASSGCPGARETFALPYAAWSREGRTSLAARIGLLPLDADAGTAVTGELAVSTKADAGGFEARAYSRPRADSVLSFAGQKDAGGAAYGRVAETGLHIQGRIPAGKTYAIQAELSGAHLGGQNIPDNSMISGGLSASRSIERTGFAYLVTGPFYQFQSYDRNTNFYTPGHGGYFSPQSFQRAGWSANAQTDPLKDWIVKGDAALAFESIEEDPAPVNPMLGSVQPLVGGSGSSGVAAALALSGARRITPEVILSANVSAIASAAYEDFRVGLALTWVPGGRASLVRTDLLADPFNPGSWIWP